MPIYSADCNAMVSGARRAMRGRSDRRSIMRRCQISLWRHPLNNVPQRIEEQCRRLRTHTADIKQT